MKKYGIGLFIILIQCLLLGSGHPNYLILLSMDGFQWNYPNLTTTPHLDYFADNGVKSEIIPAFPSKTFPNHYTLATGLLPDHHGIVLNNHYNYDKQEWYRTSDRNKVEDGSFYGGEPIWNTAEKQSVRAGTLFWVGSEADINGMHPSYWKKYQHDMLFADRIDTLVSWLKKPINSRPRLILWYLHQPDSWGHELGPDNPKLLQKIEYLDSLVGIFYHRINQLAIKDSINIIITTDHGMGDISKERVELLDNYIPKKWLSRTSGSNPIHMFEPKKEYFDRVYNALQQGSHFKCWKKSAIPADFSYGKHSNIMPIVAVADNGWSLCWEADIQDRDYLGGTHGYDPKNRDMHGIFYALGPDFKTAYSHNAFENIHLYGLLCRLLNIDPAKNDGNIKNLEAMLK